MSFFATVWPSNASFYASLTCSYLLQLASPFGQCLSAVDALTQQHKCKLAPLRVASKLLFKAGFYYGLSTNISIMHTFTHNKSRSTKESAE